MESFKTMQDISTACHFELHSPGTTFDVILPLEGVRKLKMEAVSSFIKVTVPDYLKNLPIPKTFGGFASLTGKIIYSTAILPRIF